MNPRQHENDEIVGQIMEGCLADVNEDVFSLVDDLTSLEIQNSEVGV